MLSSFKAKKKKVFNDIVVNKLKIMDQYICTNSSIS